MDSKSSIHVETIEDSVEIARRGLPHYAGIYIRGELEGLDVNYTVDTGATTAVVSSRMYEDISEAKRPQLRGRGHRRDLVNADGSPIPTLGSGQFHMMLGTLELERELVVADIEDDVLLGADIVLRDKDGPADLILSEGNMVFKGTKIKLEQVPTPQRIRKAYAADHYIVPGMSEAIVDVFVDKEENEQGDTTILIEGAPYFVEKHNLVVAPCLVDASGHATVKVRVMNPFMHPISVKQDTVVGHMQEVHLEVDLVLEEENKEESENYGQLRQISLGKQGSGLPVRMVSTGSERSCGNEIPAVPPHLEALFREATENRTPEECEAVASLLHKYGNIFSKNELDLGLTHLTEHGIETGDAKPVKQPPRRLPTAFAGEDKKAIEKLLAQDIIQPSRSPWASPVVLVKKKDGTARLCVDYRRLNSVTKKDAFPIPSTQDCLDTVAGSVLFSTMDITSAYNQVPIKKEDIPKTAFVTRSGFYEYKTMSFGLTNAPATFQRLMELALAGLQWECCLIYLDDVICFGRTFTEHMYRLDLILDRICQAGLKLKPEKTHFLKDQVVFLGHVVSKEGVLPNPENVKKILEWPIPRNVTEVRAFLGMGNYYRRFIKSFSKEMCPLFELTKARQPFKWTQDCQEAFDSLKQKLAGPDIMAYPQEEGEFVLDTDASDNCIGAVLSQVQHGVERVIAYGSKTLSKSERNYCVTYKELLAVKYFVEHYKQYILGRRFLVRTDHQALIWLFSLREPKNRIARWIESLSAFDFAVEYRKGVKHGNADTMSRCPNPRACSCMIDQDNPPLQCGPCQKCVKKTEDMCGKLSLPPERVAALRSVISPGHLVKLAAACSSPIVIVWKIINLLMAAFSYAMAVLRWAPSGVDVIRPACTNVKSRAAPTQAKVLEQLEDDGRMRPK